MIPWVLTTPFGPPVRRPRAPEKPRHGTAYHRVQQIQRLDYTEGQRGHRRQVLDQGHSETDGGGGCGAGLLTNLPGLALEYFTGRSKAAGKSQLAFQISWWNSSSISVLAAALWRSMAKQRYSGSCGRKPIF